MFALCRPKHQGVYSKGNTRKLWPKVTPPVDLSVGDNQSQIAAAWLQIVQRSQWRAYRKLQSLFLMVSSLTPYDLPSPQMGVPYAPKIRKHLAKFPQRAIRYTSCLVLGQRYFSIGILLLVFIFNVIFLVTRFSFLAQIKHLIFHCILPRVSQ